MSQTQEPEQAADAMQQRTSELGDEIEGVRRDWQAKRDDPNVPGADPPPEEAPGRREETDEPPPEAQFPAKSDD
jgi:hypothetical protein